MLMQHGSGRGGRSSMASLLLVAVLSACAVPPACGFLPVIPWAAHPSKATADAAAALPPGRVLPLGGAVRWQQTGRPGTVVMTARPCELYDIRGVLVPYSDALAWQKQLQARSISRKSPPSAPSSPPPHEEPPSTGGDALILVEHPAVYTLGSSSDYSHILFPIDTASLTNVGDVVSVGEPGCSSTDTFEVHRVQRGGKVTYHCPGQLVGYPIMDLAMHTQDIGWYLREVEGVLIDALAHFGVEANTVEGLTGVWVGGSKIAAIGVGASRWVTLHGFALNVDPACNMAGFRRIVPCGIEDRPVTSLKEVMGDACPSMAQVREAVKSAFATRFGVTLVPAQPPSNLGAA